MMSHPRDFLLSKFLVEHEFEFNEEYHSFLTSERRLELVPPDALETGSGWLLQYADTEAGEWNLARALGIPDRYLDLVNLIPNDPPFHLLVPDTHFEFLPDLLRENVQERLIWHCDENFPPENSDSESLTFSTDKVDDLAEDPPGKTSLVWRDCPGSCRTDWDRHAYLMHEGAIATMIRPVRVTPRSVEIYIETVPHLREKGMATWLLQAYRRALRAACLKLIYVVGSQNTPSLRVAAHLGLRPYQILLRIAGPFF